MILSTMSNDPQCPGYSATKCLGFLVRLALLKGTSLPLCLTLTGNFRSPPISLIKLPMVDGQGN